MWMLITILQLIFKLYHFVVQSLNFRLSHNIDTMHTRDEDIFRLSTLLRRNIIEGYIKDNELISQKSNPMIHCHYKDCSYVNNLDESVKKHRKKHILWNEMIEDLGLFWVTLNL